MAAPTLILQRPDHHKVLTLQPVGGGETRGVGIQLSSAGMPQPPRAPAYAPPQRAPPPPFGQPAAPPPRVNEEELMHTMNEFANPMKKSAPGEDGDDGPGGGEYMMDDFDESDPGDEHDDGPGGGGEYDDESEDDPDDEDGEMPAPPHHQSTAGAYGAEERVDKPSEGFRSIDEEKSDIIFKLQRLHRQGVRGMRQFTPYSDIRDMRNELTRIRTELELERSVKFQRKILMGLVSALEWGNNKFDPFDLELDGWSEQMHQSVQTSAEYDGVFEELYFKYRGKVSTPPEVRLLLMVGGSAMMFHMTKAMMKSALPNMGDMMKKNPQMMEAMLKSFAQPQGGGGAPPAQDNDDARSTASGRREMRGPGIDIGGLAGGLMGGGGGLGGGLGGLGGLLGGGLPGMGAVSASALGGVPPPPLPVAQLNPSTTRADRGAGPQRMAPPPAHHAHQQLTAAALPRRAPMDAMSDRMSDRLSDRLSDVVSEDLESIPDDLSVQSDGSDRNVHVSLPAPRGRPAKRARTDKKVITL
jgi:hypothetical protein